MFDGRAPVSDLFGFVIFLFGIHTVCCQNQSKKKMYRYELTEFPDILKNTYWGQGTVMDSGASHPSIVQNYNDFVRTHSIVRALERVPEYAESKARVYWSTDVGEYRTFPAFIRGRAIRRTASGSDEYACMMGIGHGIDHLQYFQDRSDNYVFITSPYHLRSDGTFLIEHGWERIPGLHIDGESSYIFKVPRWHCSSSSGELLSSSEE